MIYVGRGNMSEISESCLDEWKRAVNGFCTGPGRIGENSAGIFWLTLHVNFGGLLYELPRDEFMG
jgi:hypothetical protein